MSARKPLDDPPKLGDRYRFVICRYDVLISATNTKAAMIGAYSTFVLGTVVLKWGDLTSLHGKHPQLAFTALLLSFVIAASTAVSLWFLFQVISPYLKSPKKPGTYHSNIFFDHVSEHETPDDFLKVASECSDLDFEKDLGTQAHALARGLCGKYRKLRYSVFLIIWIQLPAILALLLMQLTAAVVDFW